ncbi:hypothetical protein WT66_01135 [Burkholderia stagnalis]|nr:hypothetical protein WT18_08135 [Burkholderia stagnalis]KVP12805.1 hypothetical protein WT20_09850 [Burkholderia stagnalis]KVW96312.1 hypothetical protein WT30_10905 [Burkholderia stagnalis]KWH75435.1 hypothetical protein WT66_01135 [Burkholderia stagnalis]
MRCSAVATILLVDDDPMILRPLSIMLEAKGFYVRTAQNGVDAMASTQSANPDLVVTDWRMPGGDGAALCRSLKTNPATAGIPVIMWSSESPPSTVEPLWDLLLRKPAPISELIGAIVRLLKERPSTSYVVPAV